MPSQPRNLVLNLALAAGSLLVTLLVLEAGARLIEHGQGGGKEDDARATYTDRDAVLGWRKRPGAHATYRRREYTTELVINSLGMRDVERSRLPPPGTLRALALGDSFVEAYTVPLEKAVTRVLEASLSSAACPVEVLNGGTAGYSTDQEYLYYREEAAALGARVVMLFFFYNDILYNARADYWGAPKPLLEQRDGRLEVTNGPLPTRRPPARRATREAPAGEPQRPLLRSALLDLAASRLSRSRPDLYARLADLGLWEPIGDEKPKTEMLVFQSPTIPMVEVAWQRTLSILDALSREVESHGARFLVVYVPAAFEVDDHAYEATRLAYATAGASWDRSRVARRLANAGRRRGIPVLDLTERLRAATGPLGTPYFVFDHHWNAQGHRIAAQAVAEFLRNQGWLDCRSDRDGLARP